MLEDKKIGYSAILIGAISLLEAWMNILDGQGAYIEIIFLALGLVACLIGIALILHKKQSYINK